MTREDGTVTAVPVQQVGQQVQIGTSEFYMAVATETGSASYDNSNIILKSGSETTVTGVGFKPGSTVEVWLFSTPTLLGTTIVSQDGTFSLQVTVPGDLLAGSHTLQAEGLNAAGVLRALSAGVTVSKNGFLGKTTRVQFYPSAWGLSTTTKKSLDALASKAKSSGATKVVVTGHTDSLGAAPRNMVLSKKRAQAAAAYLKLKLKGSSIKVVVQYKGEAEPAASNATKAGRAVNRRADIVAS